MTDIMNRQIRAIINIAIFRDRDSSVEIFRSLTVENTLAVVRFINSITVLDLHNNLMPFENLYYYYIQ